MNRVRRRNVELVLSNRGATIGAVERVELIRYPAPSLAIGRTLDVGFISPPHGLVDKQQSRGPQVLEDVGSLDPHARMDPGGVVAGGVDIRGDPAVQCAEAPQAANSLKLIESSERAREQPRRAEGIDTVAVRMRPQVTE